MTVSGPAAWLRALRSIGAILMSLGLHAGASAVEAVRVQECGSISLDGRHVEFARLPNDASGLEHARRAHFEPLPGRTQNFGLVDGAIWLRLSVEAGACDAPLMLQVGNPFGNRVTLHRETAAGRWLTVPAADHPSEINGNRRFRFATLSLPLDADRPVRMMVEIRGPSSIVVQPAIVPASEIHHFVVVRNLVGGLLTGAIVGLAIYCALLGVVTRLPGLIAFSVSALALAAFYGVAVGLLDPLVLWIAAGRYDVHDVTLRIDGVLALTIGLYHWFFVRGLLGATTGSGRWASAALGGWFATLFAIPFIEGPVMPLVCVAVAGVAIAAIVVKLVRGVRRRHPIARVLVLSFGALSLSVIVFAAAFLGLLPWHPTLPHAVAVGTWAEATLLAVAVGTHVKDLRGQQQQLAARTRELSLLSQLDPLTGLGNRRAYDAVVPVELERSQRRGRTASLLVIDIDRFKQVNDNYGHDFGDSVIRILGATIANSVRSTDYAFRYGGEEFVVLLPGLDDAMALEVAERIMREFTNCSPTAPDGSRPFFSVSIGLARLRPGDDAQALFGRADAAMYRAKEEGRCRIVVAEDRSSRMREYEQTTG